MTMIAGKLRHRVQIQEPTTIDDPTSGGSYETWATVATVWAQVTPARGREFWDIRKSNSEVEGRVTMRHRELDPTKRLLHKGRPLEILFITNREERGEMLEVFYKEAQT